MGRKRQLQELENLEINKLLKSSENCIQDIAGVKKYFDQNKNINEEEKQWNEQEKWEIMQYRKTQVITKNESEKIGSSYLMIIENQIEFIKDQLISWKIEDFMMDNSKNFEFKQEEYEKIQWQRKALPIFLHKWQILNAI